MNKGLEQLKSGALRADKFGMATVLPDEPEAESYLSSGADTNFRMMDSGIRYIRARQVTQMLSISRSTLYDWTNPSSKRYDPSFPKSSRLNKSTKHGAVFWLEADVLAWLRNCRESGGI